MADCIFCRIASGEIPSKKVYEDEEVLAFHDLEPQAPVHILVIPKQHVASVLEFAHCGAHLGSHILGKVIPQIAKEQGIAESGFRLVANTGKDGQQTVEHLHFHILGKRAMTWPPG